MSESITSGELCRRHKITHATLRYMRNARADFPAPLEDRGARGCLWDAEVMRRYLRAHPPARGGRVGKTTRRAVLSSLSAGATVAETARIFDLDPKTVRKIRGA